EMFGDAWRTMKYRFYDPNMHGMDWDAAKAKYQPLVKDVGDRQELLNIINEMIGELNASHTGAAPPPGGRAQGGVSTGNLGVELEPDKVAGRYKVAYIYEDGPADKDWVKVNVGDYLIAIGGKEVKAGDEFWELLNDRLNRKVEVTFDNKPTTDGGWQPRGVEASGRPFAGYFGPKVVLQNWRSASNAEMFPAGFKALGLGKTIGTPTMGAVIGTGSYSLIDASTVRTPGVGVYLADAKHTNMENYGVQPDIRIDNAPEDNLAGRDRQLETAVDELMKQIGGTKRNIASKENQ